MAARGSVTRGERAQMTCAADERNLTLSARKEDKYLICVSREVILFFFIIAMKATKPLNSLLM